MKKLIINEKHKINNVNFHFRITFLFNEKIRKIRPKISKETKLLLKNASNSTNACPILNKYYKNFYDIYSYNIAEYTRSEYHINLTFDLDNNG